MAKKKKVLIFDDELEIAQLTEKFIQYSGIETIICLNYQDLLVILENNYKNIACILLDVMMPGREGYDLLEELATNEKYQEIPIFMMGGKTYDKIFPFKEMHSKKFSHLKNFDPDVEFGDLLKDLMNDNEEDDDSITK